MSSRRQVLSRIESQSAAEKNTTPLSALDDDTDAEFAALSARSTIKPSPGPKVDLSKLSKDQLLERIRTTHKTDFADEKAYLNSQKKLFFTAIWKGAVFKELNENERLKTDPLLRAVMDNIVTEETKIDTNRGFILPDGTNFYARLNELKKEWLAFTAPLIPQRHKQTPLAALTVATAVQPKPKDDVNGIVEFFNLAATGIEKKR